MLIDPDEYIETDFWEKLAKEFGFDFVATEGVKEHFNKERGWPTLVSAYSDYSIRMQASHHPNDDLVKQSHLFDWDDAAKNKSGYVRALLGPACDMEKCDVTDPYSVKVDAYTISTFSFIPKWVRKWFVTNLDIFHDQAELIPFGLNCHQPGNALIHDLAGRPKPYLFYVNFQCSSLERFGLKAYFSRLPWVTFRSDPNLSAEQYLSEMSEHKFVLSPHGNGLDCYRNYEASYLGSVPVIQAGPFSSQLKARHVSARDLRTLTEEALNRAWLEVVGGTPSPWLTKSYWRKRFEEAT